MVIQRNLLNKSLELARSVNEELDQYVLHTLKDLVLLTDRNSQRVAPIRGLLMGTH